jgi:WXXGXW repeat (2 copies)
MKMSFPNLANAGITVRQRTIVLLCLLMIGASGCVEYYGPGYGPYYGPGVVVEVGDRPYYRGPGYWRGGAYYIWRPGHWAWRRGYRVWVPGHYVVRGY